MKHLLWLILAAEVAIFAALFFITQKINIMSKKDDELLAAAQKTNEALDNISGDITGLQTEIETLKDAISNTGASQEVIDAFAGVQQKAEALAARVPAATGTGEGPSEGNGEGAGPGEGTEQGV